MKPVVGGIVPNWERVIWTLEDCVSYHMARMLRFAQLIKHNINTAKNIHAYDFG